MNTPNISRAYQLIRTIAQDAGSNVDSLGLDESVETASINLNEEFERFGELLNELGDTVASHARGDFAGKLIFLRISVMNIGSEFQNLAEAIAHLFENESVN